MSIRWKFMLLVLLGVLIWKQHHLSLTVSKSWSSQADLWSSVLLPSTSTALVPKSDKYVVWLYPLPPAPADDTALVQAAMNIAPDDVFLCAYSTVCPDLPQVQGLNLRELTMATPYYGAIMNHTFVKVMHGLDYPDHVQSMAILSLLLKHKTACVRSWGDSKRWCGSSSKGNDDNDDDEVTRILETYDPMERAATAPCTPTSKPDLNTLEFNSLTYGGGGNSGDEVQSIAGYQFMPYINAYYNRDRQWPRAVGHVFANAWYGYFFKWPPKNPALHPTLVAMHVFAKGQQSAGTPESVAYFQNYNREVGPVGARDTATLSFLKSINVTTYLSRCLTLMLQNGCHCSNCPPCGSMKKDRIFLIDVDPKNLPVRVQNQLAAANATYLSASMLKKLDQGDTVAKVQYAHDLLSKYANQAKLIMTSRLHCALPSMALGAPVIFVDNGQKVLVGGDRSRLSGIAELLHVYSAADGDEGWTFDIENVDFHNPGVHVVDRNRASFWNYLSRRNPYYADTGRLYGLIPFQRLGSRDDVPVPKPKTSLHTDFHYVLPTKKNGDDHDDNHRNVITDLSWQEIRSMEYVFYHHPNAHILVYVPTSAVESLTREQRMRSKLHMFQDVGYSLSIVPYDRKELLSQTGTVGDKNGNDELVKSLFLERRVGGVYLDTSVFLMEPLPESLGNVWIRSTDSSETTMNDNDAMKIVGVPSLDKSCYLSSSSGIPIMAVYISEHMNETQPQSLCDEILHKFCIFCDEIHTVGA